MEIQSDVLTVIHDDSGSVSIGYQIDSRRLSSRNSIERSLETLIHCIADSGNPSHFRNGILLRCCFSRVLFRRFYQDSLQRGFATFSLYRREGRGR